MQSRLLSNSICVNCFIRALLCVMVYLISITTIIIFIQYFSIALSLLHHTLSPPPPSALHPDFLSPQKRAGLPGRSQQNTRSTTTLTLRDKPKEEKSPQSRHSVRITHTLIVGSTPQRLSQQHIRYAEDQSQTHAGSL